MPIDIKSLENGRGTEFHCYGTVTGTEIMEANDRIYDVEAILKMRYKIIDRSECTDYCVTTDEIKLIAGQDMKVAKVNRDITILLVSPTPVQYGMTRMWQVYVAETGFTTKIFADRQSADAWLSSAFGEPDQDDPSAPTACS
jgi:hypothetical protein